jgi:hypothetical protein
LAQVIGICRSISCMMKLTICHCMVKAPRMVLGAHSEENTGVVDDLAPTARPRTKLRCQQKALREFRLDSIPGNPMVHPMISAAPDMYSSELRWACFAPARTTYPREDSPTSPEHTPGRCRGHPKRRRERNKARDKDGAATAKDIVERGAAYQLESRWS